MNGVILVAPADARWATMASSQLAGEHLLHARLYEPALLPTLVRGTTVLAIAIDERLAAATLKLARRSGLSPSIRMLIISEGIHQVSHGALRSATWPTSVEAMRVLVGASTQRGEAAEQKPEQDR